MDKTLLMQFRVVENGILERTEYVLPWGRFGGSGHAVLLRLASVNTANGRELVKVFPHLRGKPCFLAVVLKIPTGLFHQIAAFVRLAARF
jgi:hypothetical protein